MGASDRQSRGYSGPGKGAAESRPAAGGTAPAFVGRANSREVEEVEIRLLLEGIQQVYGYDFRDYALASLRRRVRQAREQEGVSTLSALQDRVLHDPAAMERFLAVLSVSVTSLFRDPGFFRALRERAVPELQGLPFVRAWVAGCSTGEEAYSLAILFEEEGLAERSRIYATDIDEGVLYRAKKGIYPLSLMQDYTTAYLQSGGRRSFSEYCRARYDHALLKPRLREHIVFAGHNLATDGSFNEFQLILCRNVMIYFNPVLQDRVQRLLHASLAPGGFLGLGSHESLRFLPAEASYEEVSERMRLYRKVR